MFSIDKRSEDIEDNIIPLSLIAKSLSVRPWNTYSSETF
jgi:hypothetical protein